VEKYTSENARERGLPCSSQSIWALWLVFMVGSAVTEAAF
jgi:hypothetical protein